MRRRIEGIGRIGRIEIIGRLLEQINREMKIKVSLVLLLLLLLFLLFYYILFRLLIISLAFVSSSNKCFHYIETLHSCWNNSLLFVGRPDTIYVGYRLFKS